MPSMIASLLNQESIKDVNQEDQLVIGIPVIEEANLR